MTGTFPASIKTGLASITDTNSPARIDATTNAAAPAGAAEFDVEYTMQTGATRYAPMQKVPASKITKKKASPQYPTSSVPIAKKFLPTPKVQTTVTQSQTFSVQSMENTAKAAPMPSDDMAKFLARWKD
jgi:glucose dehydrogenase